MIILNFRYRIKQRANLAKAITLCPEVKLNGSSNGVDVVFRINLYFPLNLITAMIGVINQSKLRREPNPVGIAQHVDVIRLFLLLGSV